MPNHVYSRVVITGPVEQLQKFKESVAVQKDDEVSYNFTLLYAMPEEITNTMSPTRIVSDEEYAKKKLELEKLVSGDPEFSDILGGLPITQAMYDELIEKYGCTDWYTWAVRHWGTKWGCYDIHIVEPLGDLQDTLTFHFQTAWSPAGPLWEKISEQFPGCSFKTSYWDEGWGYAGRTTFMNGKITEEEDILCESDEGKIIASEVDYEIHDEESEEREEQLNV